MDAGRKILPLLFRGGLTITFAVVSAVGLDSAKNSYVSLNRQEFDIFKADFFTVILHKLSSSNSVIPFIFPDIKIPFWRELLLRMGPKARKCLK